VYAIYRDITERKMAEETLHQSQQQYHHLLESTHDLIQSVAPDGRFLFVNQAWLKTLGYTQAQLRV
jgi:PAS domain S-box-containing protein